MMAFQALDREQAEQERLRRQAELAPRAYEDRFMQPDDAQALAKDEPESAQDAGAHGLRGWLLESRLGMGESSDSLWGRRRATEAGMRAEYRRQTLNHGEFLLQAEGRMRRGDADVGGFGTLGYARERSGSRITLRNLGLPLSAGIFADTTLGDTYSELTQGLSRNYRLTLGSSMVRGLSTRVYGPDFDLRAGLGRRGDLAGGPYPGFEKSQGRLGWLGYTQQLGGAWYLAGQLGRAQGIPAVEYWWPGDAFTDPWLRGFDRIRSGTKDVDSWAAAIGRGGELRQSGDWRFRLTAVGSQVRTLTPGVPAGPSRGLFLEASARVGRMRHEWGAYTARPNLYFGDDALNTGTRGAYWRVDHSGNRLSWGAGLEHERYAVGQGLLLWPGVGLTTGLGAGTGSGLPGYTRHSASGNFQYLIDRRSSVGGSLSLYQSRYEAGASGARPGNLHSLYAQAFYQTQFFDWPRTRLSLTVRRNEQIVLGGGSATGQELQWEQDWIRGRYETMRPELTTTLGYAQDRSNGGDQRYPTAGVQLRYWLDSSAHVAANLRYTSRSGGLYTSRGLSGTLSAEKDLGRGWRMGLAASLNQARTANHLPVGAFGNGPQVYRGNERTAHVYLRWEGSAGRAFPVLGASAEAGSGSVSGRVFFDANRDGEAQMGEGGAAQVEVLLDGRYRTTTDRDGRFEFPMVGTGRHQLTLTLDSVPLPWGAATESGVSIHVPLRGQAHAEIPVIKVRD
ncbi:hypothetical protein PGB34_14955 [Xenophilus arseniciresistens]|uniref:SD-repeat containing protein B domain-containing protein n=1 Tax=Xenophilus arseniciresistens TaxID=1283306 RepID=A0AAE3N7W3_9BURK|nr:hypothetical protein [Xenophilus arseniciresistens]MDA7417660.1 hypothetical protein [Xenophilus arseniciresistens]